LYTLMHDPQYRLAVAWQNTAYNQPPHPGFYLGDGMSRPPTPLIRTTPRSGRLTNLSVRTAAGSGPDALIVGFNVSGNGSQRLLLRGVGPTLADFNVPGAMSDPLLNLFADSTLIGANNDWSSDNSAEQFATMAASVGAFPLPRPSRDAVLLPNLGPGNYSAHIAAASGERGIALVELYPIGPASTARLANVSARASAGTGANTLIAGFTLEGTTTRTVLIRVVGPTLAQFGVSGLLADPLLALYRDGTRIQSNDDWGKDSGATLAAFRALGAFDLPHGSKDAALLVNLPPGSYAVHASSADGGSGIALIEIYESDN
ncbi:MAG: hypothetical protein ABIZ49_13300, partial [Opitutaceae bacterium]